MAVKVTEEEIERINELYCELGVKARVAEIVGRSASTISRYIIPNYVPKAQRIEILFEKEAGNCEQLIMKIRDEIAQMCGVSEAILKNCSMDADEKEELQKLKEEIF